MVSSEGWIVGREEGVGGWTVGGLPALSSRVGGLSPLSWKPLPSAASQQDRGFSQKARESNLRRDAPSPLPVLLLTTVGSPATQREGRLGAWNQERPPLQGDRPPRAALGIQDCAPTAPTAGGPAARGSLGDSGPCTYGPHCRGTGRPGQPRGFRTVHLWPPLQGDRPPRAASGI